MKKYLLILTIAFLSFSASAQMPKASVNDLTLLAGDWRLKHKWGDMQEIWSLPMGDNLISTYRCVKESEVVFYEFMVVEQGPDLTVLKLRHFNKGSIGWEEKNEPYLMPATKVGKNEVVFLSTDKKVQITYKRLAVDKLDCILDELDKNGKWTKEVFS